MVLGMDARTQMLLDRWDDSVAVTRTEYTYANVKPQPKQSTRFGKGRAFTSAKKRAYVKLLGEELAKHFTGKAPLSGDVRVSVLYSFPWRQSDKDVVRDLGWAFMNVRPDVDNLFKPLADSLQGICFDDDGQVVEVRARKIRSDEQGIAVRLDTVIRNGSLNVNELIQLI